MLLALMEKIRDKYPKARFVLPALNHDYEQRMFLGTYQKFALRVAGIDLGFVGNWIPTRLKHKYGVISDGEIDVIIDASGFAYGDQWGSKKLLQRLGKVSKWKRQGKKVIALPQALGPFTSEGFEQACREVFPNVDLLFARDSISYKHAAAYTSDNLFQFGDFTNLATPEQATSAFAENADVCIIPNTKMLQMNDQAQGHRYIECMIALTRSMIEKNRKPFFLVHEGKGDRELAEQIRDAVDSNIPLLDPKDALEIKRIIGASSIVISSRFHGLVSALSQGVPVIATGWSHKYQMLLKDYHCEELLIGLDDDNSWRACVEAVTNQEQFTAYKGVISRQAKTLKHETEAMWAKVFELLAR